MADVDTGMDKQDMKRLLLKSKQEPLNCAFGQGAEPSVGLLMIDRVKQPKALDKELGKAFPDAKNTRWGTAFVDVDDNPKLVKFRINKPVSGMARKLAKTLRGTGFTKVEILLDDGTPVEAYSEEEEGEAATAAAGPPPLPAAGADIGALQRALAALIPRIQTVADPAHKAALAKLAAEINGQLKANAPGEAASSIDRLREALDAPATGAPTPPQLPPPSRPPRPEARPRVR